MTTLLEDAAALKALKKLKDDAKKEFSAKEKDFKTAQYKLMQRMEDEGAEGVKTDGTNFIPTCTIYGQVQDERLFVEWAAEERPELIEYKPRGEQINELVRQLLDDKEPFPPGLGTRETEYISQRAVAKK